MRAITIIWWGFLGVASAVGVIETAGTLPLTAGVPPTQASLCAEQCRMSQEVCQAGDFKKFLKAISSSRDITFKHLTGAWASTVWRPPETVAYMLDQWGRNKTLWTDRRPPLQATVPFVHGLVWEPMWTFQAPGEPVDAAALVAHVLSDLLGDDLLSSPPFTQEIVHGIGHGALFAAAKAAGLPAVSCLTRRLSVPTQVVRAAEAVCDALPFADLGHVCATGLYHTLEVPQSYERPDTLALVARASYLDVCDGAKFVAMCVYTALRDALRDRTYRPSFEIAALDAATHKPRPGSLDELCPETRWPRPSDRRSCFYGMAAAFARVSPDLGFRDNRIGVPSTFDWCRPRRSDWDRETAQRTAACVAGALLNPTIHLSDHVYAFVNANSTAFVASCRAACQTLAADVNANMRAAVPACANHLLCADLNSTFGVLRRSPGDVFVNASLLEAAEVDRSDGYYRAATSYIGL